MLVDLQSDLKKDERPHAMLIHGPVGCGKTTIGRIIATEVGCVGNDFREIDSADFRGIDTIREIRKQSQYKPMEGESRVWLIDECHKLTNDAQNALLKSLEAATTHVYYILATTDPQKLLDTVRSRCTKYQVNPLSDEQMFQLLHNVIKAEGESLPKAVYTQIIQDSQGHPRDALQILDKTLSAEPERRLEVAKQQAALLNQTIELCRALIQKADWKKVSSILNGMKSKEPEKIRRAILGYCSSVLLNGDNMAAAMIMEQLVEPTYDMGFPGITYACYSAVKLIKS